MKLINADKSVYLKPNLNVDWIITLVDGYKAWMREAEKYARENWPNGIADEIALEFTGSRQLPRSDIERDFLRTLGQALIAAATDRMLELSVERSDHLPTKKTKGQK